LEDGAKYSECVSAARELDDIVLLLLDSSADGFGEGVRTVILKSNFAAKRCSFQNAQEFFVLRSLFQNIR